MLVTLGQQYDVGAKPTVILPTVILYTYINRHAGTHQKNIKNKTETHLRDDDGAQKENVVLF